jgi:hypothetical protein
VRVPRRCHVVLPLTSSPGKLLRKRRAKFDYRMRLRLWRGLQPHLSVWYTDGDMRTRGNTLSIPSMPTPDIGAHLLGDGA